MIQKTQVNLSKGHPISFCMEKGCLNSAGIVSAEVLGTHNMGSSHSFNATGFTALSFLEAMAALVVLVVVWHAHTLLQYRKLLFYSLLNLSLWCSSKNPVTQWWFWLKKETKFSSPQRKPQVTNSTWCLWMFSQRRTPSFAMVSVLGFERNWRGEQSSSWESGWGGVSCRSPSFVFGQAESLPAIESTLISNASVFHHQICVRCNGYSLAFNVSSDVTFSYSSACYGDCQPKK